MSVEQKVATKKRYESNEHDSWNMCLPKNLLAKYKIKPKSNKNIYASTWHWKVIKVIQLHSWLLMCHERWHML